MNPMQLPANRTCPIAGTLSLVGQKWSLLLLREAFAGTTRFADFQRIGIPTATLGARLDGLVAAGLLERRSYQESGERARQEYQLTDAGRDMLPIFAALSEWGRNHLDLPQDPIVRFESTAESPVHLEFVDQFGARVSTRDVHVTRSKD